MREILWQNGKFVRRDGSTFIPYGGVFAEIIYTDRCGIKKGSRPDADDTENWMFFYDATEEELRIWLHYLKSESMNYVRYFCLSARRNCAAPLDVGGKPNPLTWPKLLRYMDIAAEEGVYFHFVMCPEPRTTIYFRKDQLEKYGLPFYTPEEIAGLPEHRRRFLNPQEPRVGYNGYFTDPDILRCQFDFIDAIAPALRDHPALLCAEVYNEQGWDNDQFQHGACFLWEQQDNEIEWTRHIVEHIKQAMPGVPTCISFAGLGFAAQDPFLWLDKVPVDFFSPHLYQGLAGIPLWLDFAGIVDVNHHYTQNELPTMFGELDPSDFKAGMGTEALAIRDMAWFALLDNCPGLGMWTSRGFGEFEIPRRVAEQVNLNHVQLKAPEVMVNIKSQVAYFHSLEHGAGPDCLLPGDYWCPHRPEDTDHIYCKKFMSRELADFYNWGHYALTNGISYSFTRHPERFAATWDIRDLSAVGLQSIHRPFVPSAGSQLKYLSSADDALHIVYLRQFTYYRVGINSGRKKGSARPVNIKLNLPEGGYAVEIWNLDQRVRSERTCQAQDRLDLGATMDDFALVLHRL
ncbi:MAG: hypothetical protein LLG44_00125 [Chloroflexi bacterium]|nr:hypothetical protein [Chloroflexota bacterium]